MLLIIFGPTAGVCGGNGGRGGGVRGNGVRGGGVRGGVGVGLGTLPLFVDLFRSANWTIKSGLALIIGSCIFSRLLISFWISVSDLVAISAAILVNSHRTIRFSACMSLPEIAFLSLSSSVLNFELFALSNISIVADTICATRSFDATPLYPLWRFFTALRASSSFL